MNRRKTVFLALVALGTLGFAGVGCAQKKAPAGAAAAPSASATDHEPFGRFSIADLEAKMQAAKAGQLKLFIYDNNSQERYKKSHLPGAKWVNYEAITENDLPKDKDATLVFYCANER
jgi:hypothetical protein